MVAFRWVTRMSPLCRQGFSYTQNAFGPSFRHSKFAGRRLRFNKPTYSLSSLQMYTHKMMMVGSKVPLTFQF